MKQFKFGSFMCRSAFIQATDPCYDNGNTVFAVLGGRWFAEMLTLENNETGGWGTRVAELFIVQEKYQNQVPIWQQFTNHTFPVDSGQFGFFDQTCWLADSTAPGAGEYVPGSWYFELGQQTLSPAQGGIVRDYGCVASSGYGDGSYNIYLWTDQESGTIIGLRIVFIDENDRG